MLVFSYLERQEMFCTSLFLSVMSCYTMIMFPVCLFSCCFSRHEGEVGQEILCGRRLQLHLVAAQPGGRHAVRRGQGGAVCPQPLGHQQDQATEEREHLERAKIAMSSLLQNVQNWAH